MVVEATCHFQGEEQMLKAGTPCFVDNMALYLQVACLVLVGASSYQDQAGTEKFHYSHACDTSRHQL